MPEYKKKKRGTFFSARKRTKKTVKPPQKNDDIMMSQMSHNSEKVKPHQKIKVVKGNKQNRIKKAKITAIVALVVVVVMVVLNMILPSGIIQTVSNSISLIGAGSYPLTLSGSETLNSVSCGTYYFVLTDTHIDAFSNAGKLLFSHSHGFERPVLKTSHSGVLIFNQGGTQALIFDLNKLKLTVQTAREIISGDISDSGSFVLVTQSDKYASEVLVYNKKGQTVYEWYSANDMVNNAIISPNGKKIAVTTVNASSGRLISVLSVLDFKSANAEYSQTFDGKMVYTLSGDFKSGFYVVNSNEIEFVKWHKYKKIEYKNEYNSYIFRNGNSGTVAVFNRESDKTDNRIAVFSKSGKLKAEFQFNRVISDINYSNGHIYCMSDNEVYLLDLDGKVLRRGNCGFGAVSLSVIGANTVAVVTDNEIEKIKLE